EPMQIVGVMPREFIFPSRTIDAWLPLLTTLPPNTQIRHDLHFLQAVARLRPGVAQDRAQAELDIIAATYKSAHPNESTAKAATVMPLRDLLLGNSRRALAVIFGAVFCVLLIACVNIANLLLTRASARAREMGIRAALGAGRARIVRQLLTESVLLGIIGGGTGVILASWIAGFLVSRAPGADGILPAGSDP